MDAASFPGSACTARALGVHSPSGSMLRVWGLGFGVWGLGFGVWGLGFGVWGLGFGGWGFGRSVLVRNF